MRLKLAGCTHLHMCLLRFVHQAANGQSVISTDIAIHSDYPNGVKFLNQLQVLLAIKLFTLDYAGRKHLQDE